jgi:rod shape-determining protein MreD
MLAAFIQGPLVRVIPVGILLLALQRTLMVELAIDGVVLQLLAAFAAAAGAVGGSERGALVGFTVGIMYDLVEGTPLGSTALAYSLAGIAAGLLALVVAEPHWWLAMIFTGLGTAVGELAVPAVRFFIGETDTFDERLRTIVPIVAVGGAIMGAVLVPLARWSLRMKSEEWKEPAAEAGV